MLRDPKAQALVENFAGQWLQLRNLRSLNPDRGRFPNFDDKLREAMIRETELFFGAVMRGDSSILDFIDSDFTYVNERLARHYGIPGIKGEQFRRVKLKGRERGGLVTQASILTVTSNPTRTSPVKRGKWVLEQLLGTPPPPPPPNVPVLTEDAKGPDCGDFAVADGATSLQGELCGVSQQAGSAGIRAREFRRHRRLARPGQWCAG